MRPLRLPAQRLLKPRPPIYYSPTVLPSSKCHAITYSTAAPTSSPTINVTTLPAPHCGHIRILSLNRPQARNAISRQLLAELRREVDGVYADAERGAEGTRALILASEVDVSFCAGADLKERRGMSREETTTFLTTLRNTFTRIAKLPIPTLTALAAPALGGGLELALTTHFRIFGSTAMVALPETRLGIIPGAGGTHRLPALVGAGRARELILTGRQVSAGEAWDMGLCDRVVEVEFSELRAARTSDSEEERKERGAWPRRKVLEEAVRMAEKICEGGPVATRAALGALDSAQRGEGQEGENRWYEQVVETEDRNEALKAFAEKRKPVFKGR
ncbi:MAG: hypothetical protein M1822_001269 [Bathelium mastoideum]|nr:MAG: hypothetical protein M1822_001269 [Bathelium mastoideum]